MKVAQIPATDEFRRLLEEKGVLFGEQSKPHVYDNCIIPDKVYEEELVGYLDGHFLDVPDIDGLVPGIAVKVLEIRDHATCIPVICMRLHMEGIPEPAQWLLRRGGWGEHSSPVYMIDVPEPETFTTYDALKQRSGTREIAHEYIEQHWYDIKNGQVIDVQFIMGHTTEPKESDRHAEGA